MNLTKTLAPLAVVLAVTAIPARAEHTTADLVALRLAPPAGEGVRTERQSSEAEPAAYEAVDCFYADNARLPMCEAKAERNR